MEASVAPEDAPLFASPLTLQGLVRETQERVLRASGQTEPQALASAISQALQADAEVKVRALGAPAIARMAKACVIARGYVAERGKDLVLRPGYEEIMVPDNDQPGTDAMVSRRAVIFIISTVSH